MQSASNFSL